MLIDIAHFAGEENSAILGNVMILEEYIRITKELLDYPEFRLGLQLFRGILYVMVGVIAALALLHMLYFLGRRTPLYRKKAPVRGWNRRFFVSAVVLVIVILLVSWGVGALLAHMS